MLQAVSYSGPTISALLTGLVAYYKMDEGAGQNALDASGNGHTLPQFNGVGTGSGIINTARVLSVSPAAYLQNASPLITSGDISFSVWFKYTGTQDSINHFVLCQGTTLALSQYILLSPSAVSGGNIRASVADTGNEISFNVADVTQWFHVVLTGSVANSRSRLYVNGVLQSSNAAGPTYPAMDFFGFGFNSNFLNFIGSVDEAGVWNRELSGAEVANLFNNGLALSFANF